MHAHSSSISMLQLVLIYSSCMPFSQKDFIGLPPLANHDFGFLRNTCTVLYADSMHALPFISSLQRRWLSKATCAAIPFPVPTFRVIVTSRVF